MIVSSNKCMKGVLRMIKKLWLRDYDLPKMHEDIKAALAISVEPDDCVVDINDDEIESINKFLERLRSYGCGYHKQLEKQMLNKIKKLKSHKK